MSTAERIVAFACAALACATGLFAAEGRTPIYQPTTITAPGRYVVTRNLSSPGAPVINVVASNVTIDLDGHTLDSGAYCTVCATSVEGFVLRNGTLINTGSSWAIWVNEGRAVTLEDLRVSGQGVSTIRLDSNRGFVLRRLILRNDVDTGLYMSNVEDGVVEDVVADQVQARGIGLFGGQRVRIARVTLRAQAALDTAIDAQCVQCVIENNLIEGARRGIRANTSFSRITDNALDGCEDCLEVNGLSNRVLRNTVGGTSNGIVVNTDGHIIEDNHLHGRGTGCGLRIGATTGVIYRANVARGYACACSGSGTTDFCDEFGAGNLSGGDNFMPGRM